MLSRLGILLFVPLFLLSFTGVRAQDMDYLRHGKIFNLCGYKKECSQCYECAKRRYIVRILNKENKTIKKVSYKFYSDVYNKIMTKEATVKGDKIEPKQIGLLYVCVPNGDHWAISEIVYTDGTSYSFVVHDRLENFQQEADECDCNDEHFKPLQ